MIYQKTGFWAFDHSCKWDQLTEPQHTHLILEALSDRETCIQQGNEGSYTLYGKNDALLVVPRLLSTRLLLRLYHVIRYAQTRKVSIVQP